MQPLESSLLGFGIPIDGVVVENIPDGCTLARIRGRPREFIRVYIRRGRSFECWYCDFTDLSRKTLRLTLQVAANIRPAPPTHPVMQESRGSFIPSPNQVLPPRPGPWPWPANKQATAKWLADNC